MSWPARASIAWIALAGCMTLQGHPESPAYIVRATPESRAALAQAVEQALAGIQVTLDDDALTHSAGLEIEPAQRRDPRPLFADGRDPQGPGTGERFHLVKVGEHCILVHDRTGRHYDLIGTVCAPL